MEIISILRILRRRWLLLLPGVALAALAGLTVLYQVPSMKSRETVSGTASGRVLLAARDVPAFDLDSGISGTLPNRAVMLSDLMATDRSRASIARRAGVDAADLAILGPASGAPEIGVPIAVESTAAASLAYEPYVVNITTEAQVPIITVRGSASDSATAAKLVDATRAEMEKTIASDSGAQKVIGAERLGPVAQRTVRDAPAMPLGIAVAMLVFGFWACGVVIAIGLLRRLRGYRTATSVASPAT
jgi:hypothetical protein